MGFYCIKKEIDLEIITASGGMIQNQVAIQRAKLANPKINYDVNYFWQNNVVLYLLVKERDLKIGLVIKFW